jgi:hypothetical protein
MLLHWLIRQGTALPNTLVPLTRALLPCCAVICLQHIDGYCAAPHSVCFSSAVLDEAPLAAELLAEPTRIALPRTGLLKVGDPCKQLCWALILLTRNNLGCWLGPGYVMHRPTKCACMLCALHCALRCWACVSGGFESTLHDSQPFGMFLCLALRPAHCRCALLTCAPCLLRRRR